MAFCKNLQTSLRVGVNTCSALVFLCFWSAVGNVAHSAPGDEVEIRSSVEAEPSESDWFSITGLPEDLIEHLQDAELTTSDWQRMFPVAVDQPDLTLAIEQPAMAGRYSADDGTIQFVPRFPLSPRISYRATFHPNGIPAELNFDGKPVSRVFVIPKRENARPTSVVAIYPSNDALPENLLKFYVHFTAPMSGDRVHRFIQLINEKNGPVELPFLELDNALWNIDMTQLTLFIDPGRIKREVKPLEEIGPSLLSGQRYRLIINDAWLDANGNKLAAPHTKSFDVTAPDRTSPKIGDWKLKIPAAGTMEPLIVSFGESIDRALAFRMIRVDTANRDEIDGNVSLRENETEWHFVPKSRWTPGDYLLTVQTTIEDLAGNNIGKLFEVDLRRETGLKPLPKFARRAFTVK